MKKSTIIVISTIAALTASTHLLANNTGRYLGMGIGVMDDQTGAEAAIGVRKDTSEFGVAINASGINATNDVVEHHQTTTGNEYNIGARAYFAKIIPTDGIWSFRYGLGLGYVTEHNNNTVSDGSAYHIGTAIFFGPSVDLGQSASLNIVSDLLDYTYSKTDEGDVTYSQWHVLHGVGVELSYFF